MRFCPRLANGLKCKKVYKKTKRRSHMSMHYLQPLFALIAGILILVMPKMLHYIVAVYLIVYALIGFGLLR